MLISLACPFWLFIHREMMKGLYALERMILLLSMMYIYTEVNSKYILTNIKYVILVQRNLIAVKCMFYIYILLKLICTCIMFRHQTIYMILLGVHELN